jgi:glutamate--cysteine ligase
MPTVKTKHELEQFLCHNWNQVNQLLDEWQSALPQPIYSSVDVRESGHKYAPVDHNLYPAGFNNICQKDLTKASALFKQAIEKHAPGAKTIALVPESHTKNKWYLDNIYHLRSTIEGAGYHVEVVTPDASPFPDGPRMTLESQSGHEILLHQVRVDAGVFKRADGNPAKYDAVVLNNDQSNPLDVNWTAFKTPIMPSPFAGWTRRQKNRHFSLYRDIANAFCEHFDIDPDLIQAKFRAVDGVDFETKEGIDKLADEVGDLLAELPSGSSVFAKASQGTYGMGISVFQSKEEVLAMNRRARNKMDVGKNNIKFTSILVQEGVETVVKVENAPAEITVYLVDGKGMGGFMRYNPERGTNANLNSQGMLYRKFCISDICQDTDTHIKEAAYTVVARLIVLAASKEIQDINEGTK